MLKGHSLDSGDQAQALLRELRELRCAMVNRQSKIDNALALADGELGIGGRELGVGSPTPNPHSLTASSEATFGVPGTPITSGFLLDLGEYNAELMGRNAIPTYEKMRRTDAQVRATLWACKLPILSAKWEIMPASLETRKSKLENRSSDVPVSSFQFPVSNTGAGKPTDAKAKEAAEFVRENLFGGLETRTGNGAWASQNWQSVIANALLMLDFGCAVHEDVWTVDGDVIRLRSLPSRLPLTFYRWHTEPDGETLVALEQYGYRRQEFLNVLLPAGKMARFTYQQEGANFWGIALQRAMYPHWFIKTSLYRLEGITNERNSLGIPVFRLAPGFSSEDKQAAYNYVTRLASHEATGMVEPPGDATTGFRIVGYQGQLRDLLPSIQHHNEMIARAALNTFMDLGQSAHGSRALGATATDFFMLGLQSIADQIAADITSSTIRRLVRLNFGDDAPCPKLVAGNVQARSFADMTQELVSLAEQGLIVSERNIRAHIREKLALPEESSEAVVATRGETVDTGSPAGAVSGRSGGSVEGQG
jgi:hypothetical protein